MRIKATLMRGRDLKPGDLFSTAGQSYWETMNARGAIGEKVYVRTNMPSECAPDSNEPIYKIEVILDNPPI